MAISVVEFVLDLPSTVKGSHRLVLVTLATYADREGGRVYPSLSTLARRTALSERQVRRILRKLETDGYLIMVAPEQQHLPCMYRLSLKPIVRADIAMSPLKPKSRNARADKSGIQGGHFEPSGRTFSTVRADIAMSADPRDPRDPRDPKNSGADAPRHARTETTTETPKASLAVLVRLAHDVQEADPDGNSDGLYAAWSDALKTRAAQLGIPYNSNVIGLALTSAEFQRKQKKGGSADDYEPGRRRQRRSGRHHGASRAD